MIYITGDTHGDFKRVADFCFRVGTSKNDVLIILGDSGLNYYDPSRSKYLKMFVQELPITIFCIHGNHEMRPEALPSYKTKEWRGGTVYYEDGFPSLLFAKDGSVFDFDGVSTAVIGGAYSIDKLRRIVLGLGWWNYEQPSQEIKDRFVSALEARNWNVDVILSHTCPLKYEPVEVFLPGFNQQDVDRTTERFLDSIEDRASYKRWYCGHFHTNKRIDKMSFLFDDILAFADNLPY